MLISKKKLIKMSDVDDDFMCEDEEDYGLVSTLIFFMFVIFVFFF